MAITQDADGKRVFQDEDIATVADMPADIGRAIIAAYEQQNGKGSQGNA